MQSGEPSMCKRIITGVVILASLIACQALAEEPKTVSIPDQTISARALDGQKLVGTLWDSEYSGVHFLAVPEPAISLPPEYRPENLLAKLDPALQVESIGTPPFDGPKDAEAIRSSLPNTAFRLKQLVSADGQMLVDLGEPAVVVYVTGYKSSPGHPPSLEDIKNARFKDDKRVYISEYLVSIGDLPPCHRYDGLCSFRK
jgi:hypothetical protein